MVARGIIFLLLLACLTGGASYADPGETDENEGHYDRLTGEYHYHRTVDPFVGRDIVAIQSRAIADAERDVLRDAKSDNTWYGAGFLFGLLGIGAAYVMTPDVPPVNLLGKSPEYIIFYTSAYEQAMRQEHVEQATTGCIAWGGVIALYYLYSSGQL